MKRIFPHNPYIQYGDYRGGIVADDSDSGLLLPWLSVLAKVPDSHFAIGFDLNMNEVTGSTACSIYVFAVDRATVGSSAAEIMDYGKHGKTIKPDCFEIEEELDLVEVTKRMKRLSFQMGLQFIASENLSVEIELP